MAHRSELDEIVEHFMLPPDDAVLPWSTSEATRLRSALLLRFFTQRGRFPGGRRELAILRRLDIAARLSLGAGARS